MAKHTRKHKRSKDASAVVAIARKAMPHDILQALANEYKRYPRRSQTDGQYEFWIKVAKSTANLASGMAKWAEEMYDEDEDE